MSEVKAGIPRLAGKLAVAAAINAAKRWLPNTASMGNPSSLAGEPWGLAQYGVALAVAVLGPKLLGKFVNPTEFRRGAVDLILQKAVWTQGIARIPMAQQWFGAIGDQEYDNNGQGWIEDGGQMHAMQGLMSAGPMDGLVSKSPFDGYLPSVTPAAEASKSAYRGTGSSDPYVY